MRSATRTGHRSAYGRTTRCHRRVPADEQPVLFEQGAEDLRGGGPPPGLPEGHTASEKRGREFFVDAPWNPPSKKGVCALCHGGPMLNTANEFTTDATGAPPGWRAFDISGELAKPPEQSGSHVRGH